MKMQLTRPRRPMRTVAIAATLFATLVASSWTAAAVASAATLHVCEHGCAYTRIADAVSAARSGDVVNIAAGNYTGGFTIDTDLTLVGAGASQTTISGGGPVITVGVPNAASEPTVRISGVTITQGDTRSSFGVGYIALGGGVWVPPAADNATGATLTISASVIAHNAVTPAKAVDAGFSCGPTGDCRFALAGGGGIDSWGDVTLVDTAVTDNEVAGVVTSDADGGGIYSNEGTLSLKRSVIADNQAMVSAPDGRFAEGAGIMFDTSFTGPAACTASAPACTLLIRDSVVKGNTSAVTSSLPSFGAGQLIVIAANAGGIHVGNGVATTVENTTINRNSATATDLDGEPDAFDSAMIVGDSPLTMQNVSVDHNRAITASATSADSGPSGSAIELDGPGTIRDAKIDDNLSTSVSPDGVAAGTGALAVFDITGDPTVVTVENSLISGNVVRAQSSTGSADIFGAAVLNDSLLSMHNVQIRDNLGQADAPTGAAQGAGIWNGDGFSGPPVQLTLSDSSITRNALTGTPGVALQGGGLFSTSPVTLTNTKIRKNRPGQCVDLCLQQVHTTIGSRAQVPSWQGLESDPAALARLAVRR
jgi:hypothetical protein